MAELRAWITDEPIGADTVLPLVADDAHGAAVVFLGTVRNHNDGRSVRAVHYDAYRAMAERMLLDIIEEAAARIGAARIAAVHRLGDLAVGEVSIAIAAATPHRAEAFDACRYVIEEVKKRLAVWKQERYVSGESSWLDGTVPPVPEVKS